VTAPAPAPAPLVPLAADGPELSAVVAGVWRLASWGMDVAERVRWIEACLDLGVTTFDHADVYGDYQVEALFGEALAAAPRLRDRIQLVSKCGIRLVSARRPAHALKSYDTSPAHVTASVEGSLRALGVDHLDLLLLHRPDPLMDPDALAETFRALRESGKVRHVGVSNHAPSQLALLHARHPVATNQVELSPLHLAPLHDGTLDQCVALGIRPMTWSPLAGGRLLAGDDAAAARVRETLEGIARERGASAATVAFAWVLRHPSRPVPITGTRRVEGIAEAVAALALPLSAEEWYRVWQAGAGHEVP
jgi:predicted oxidoreductase